MGKESRSKRSAAQSHHGGDDLRSGFQGALLRLAQRLTRRLRAGDPLAGRVALTKGDFILAGLGGVVGESWRRLAGRGPDRGKVSVERP